jgi:predicted transcriptional regulator
MVQVTFRIEEEKRARLDALAAMQNRDRSYLINEALDVYIGVQAWQLAEIDNGLAELDRGEYASEEEIKAAFALWEQ